VTELAVFDHVIPTPPITGEIEQFRPEFRTLALTPLLQGQGHLSFVTHLAVRPSGPALLWRLTPVERMGRSRQLYNIRTDGKRALWLRIEVSHIARYPGVQSPVQHSSNHLATAPQ
jgi:hypothetical protein